MTRLAMMVLVIAAAVVVVVVAAAAANAMTTDAKGQQQQADALNLSNMTGRELELAKRGLADKEPISSLGEPISLMEEVQKQVQNTNATGRLLDCTLEFAGDIEAERECYDDVLEK